MSNYSDYKTAAKALIKALRQLDAETLKVTTAFARLIPHDGTRGARVTTSTATLEDIWIAILTVYNDPSLVLTKELGEKYIEAIRPVFRNLGVAGA